MFEQAFKNIDDVLWKEAGCTTELDYTEQISWLLFLKYLDGLEQDKATEAAPEGKKYTFDYLRSTGPRTGLTTKDIKTLQTRTFFGKEKKSLAYVIAIMNMILHGIETPNIIHTNTLTENLADIQERDRYDVILANRPFDGKERKEVQQNFHIRTGETAFLFLQHFIKMLRAGVRAGVVIKNTFLFLTYLLNSPVLKQVLHDNEVNNARANLSLGFFSQLAVPTPPISEQRRIVTALDAVRAETQRLACLYQRKLAALEALKKSLLHQAFTGEL